MSLSLSIPLTRVFSSPLRRVAARAALAAALIFALPQVAKAQQRGTISVANGGQSVVSSGGSAVIGGQARLAEDESSGARLTTESGGRIQATRTLDAPDGRNVAGLGAVLTSEVSLGETTVVRVHRVTETGISDESIARYYDITTSAEGSMNATFAFNYREAELNGLEESMLAFYLSEDDGESYESLGAETRDPEANTVTRSDLRTLDARFTLARGTGGGGLFAPTGLTATGTEEAIELSFTPSMSDAADETLVYRSSSPSEPGPVIATLDEDTTSYIDTSVQEGTMYFYRLTVRSTDGTESSFSSTANAFLSPSAITYETSQSFGNISETTDYRLVGLPGAEEVPLTQVLEGEPGLDWTAYRQSDDGTELIPYRASTEGFAFAPGEGYWVISKSDLSYSAEVPVPNLEDDGTYRLDLHAGWNIISNPFARDFDWSAVQDASGASEPLWSFAGGSYEQVSTFASGTQSAQAYYFFNQEGREELVLPYATEGTSPEENDEAQLARDREREDAGSPEAVQWALELTSARDTIEAGKKEGSASAEASASFTATVRVGVATEAKTGIDLRDVFAPPGRFEGISLGLLPGEAPTADSPELAAAYRPPPSGGTQGHRFRLVLRSEPGEEVALRRNVEKRLPAGYEALVIRQANGGESFPLSGTVRFTPTSEREQLLLVVGSSSFVEEAAAETIPDEPALVGSYPNPFRERATVAYEVAEKSNVSLVVYDALGRKVRTLVEGTRGPGRHKASFRARSLASGVYLFRLRIGDHVETGRLVHVH